MPGGMSITGDHHGVGVDLEAAGQWPGGVSLYGDIHPVLQDDGIIAAVCHQMTR
jgi:hypothetical protein